MAQIPKPKSIVVIKSAPLYQESQIHPKSKTEQQFEQDTSDGVIDIDSLLNKIQKDVDQISSDFVDFDTRIQTRVLDMIKSSKQHMEWLSNTTKSTAVIAQKGTNMMRFRDDPNIGSAFSGEVGQTAVGKLTVSTE